eukprot:1423278-Rhodomonas_salina.1
MGSYDLKVEGNEMRHPMLLDSRLGCPVELEAGRDMGCAVPPASSVLLKQRASDGPPAAIQRTPGPRA